MGNGIIHSNPMMERPSHLSPVKYSAAYSKGRESGEKRCCVTLTVSGEGGSTIEAGDTKL